MRIEGGAGGEEDGPRRVVVDHPQEGHEPVQHQLAVDGVPGPRWIGERREGRDPALHPAHEGNAVAHVEKPADAGERDEEDRVPRHLAPPVRRLEREGEAVAEAQRRSEVQGIAHRERIWERSAAGCTDTSRAASSTSALNSFSQAEVVG